MVTNTKHDTKHTYEYGDKCVNMEEEGNTYEYLDTHTQELE